MIIPAEALVGREAILAAVDHHPFFRHTVPRHAPVRGWRHEGAVCWLLSSPQSTVCAAVGPPDAAVTLVAALAEERTLDPGQWVHLPRRDPATDRAGAVVAAYRDWDFLWTTGAPPPQPGEEHVVRLDAADHPALTALIDAAFPTSTARPGDPRIVDWYGIRDGDRLIAAGADRTRDEVGFLAGLVVCPTHRNQGLGAALTAGMTRALSRRYDMVALGVYPDNTGAIRLYRRLGYTGAFPLTSVRLPAPADAPPDARAARQAGR
ncbi:GNAT family N-acetyltransferase [Micromonospora sp. NPDC003816]|uniref:GNAT family N-acetyltransferase n=1 Tax=Micromonospora sp. NPDC003816 TaxID=3364224 RepID=UPI0036CA8931